MEGRDTIHHLRETKIKQKGTLAVAKVPLKIFPKKEKTSCTVRTLLKLQVSALTLRSRGRLPPAMTPCTGIAKLVSC